MAVRLGGVTRQAMSWSFVLVSLFVPARHAAAQRVAGIIDAVMRVLHGAPASNK